MTDTLLITETIGATLPGHGGSITFRSEECRARARGVALVILTALLLLSGGSAAAQPDAPPDLRPAITHDIGNREPLVTRLTLHWENDWWYAARNEDRNYTNGFGIHVSGRIVDAPWDNPWSSCLWLCLPIALDSLNELIGVAQLHRAVDGGARATHSLMLASTAFTPDDLASADVIPDDRPYASLLYLAASRLAVNEDRDRAFTSELTVGLLGLDITEHAQTKWHQGLRDEGDVTPVDPKGWSHQISDDVEPTARYRLQLRDLVWSSCFHDVSTSVDGSVGYYTNAAAGAAARVGIISTPFWLFDSSPLDAGDQRAPARQCAVRSWPVELFAWAAGRSRFVLYNALLQGQFRHSDHRFDFEDVERQVFESEAGLTLGLWWFTMTYIAVAAHTAEFRSDEARAHTWGGVWLGYRASWGGDE
jgi:hypothetical protein